MKPAVAVIDIGSNSIKLLVAARAAGGGLEVLKTQTVDARISAGISRAGPRLGEEGMSSGLEAIRSLLKEAGGFSPERIILVATSAVRDAVNGPDFRERVRAATGHEIRILAGEEEAGLIGRGLVCDAALGGLRDFYVFDLGGGSLECLAFRERRIRRAASLQLGCVRLTEKFVADPAQPFSAAEQAAIARHTREVLQSSAFAFDLGAAAVAAGTGGTLTVARAILGLRAGQTLESSSPIVTVPELRALLDSIGTLGLAARKKIPGLPAPRADVMPAALATLIAVAEAGGLKSYHHSFHNLRYGLADESLPRREP
ncbi:MAG: phosphatase [Verrucomicrobia bacterium]|nr:phosphatase [Verrucomicrobiota bacterium]